jgi:hypothetical protein
VICARLRGAGTVDTRLGDAEGCRLVLTTEDPAFAPDPAPPVIDLERGTLTFQRPGAVILRCGL